MKRRTWIIISILAVVGVASFVGILAGGVWAAQTLTIYRQVAGKLPAERVAAQRAGIYVSGDDLIRMRKAPPGPNAADLWEEITRRLTARPMPDPLDKAVVALLSGQDTPANRAGTQKALAQYAGVIHLVEQATALPVCGFQWDWRLGPNVMFPEFAQGRAMARLITARALLESAEGHPEQAMRSLSTVVAIGKQMGSDPTIISMLVQVAIEAIADRAWQRIVAANSGNSTLLQAAAKTSHDFGPLPDLRAPILGEMVMGRDVMEELRRGKLPDDTLSAIYSQIRKDSVMVDAYEERFLAYWLRIVQGLDAASVRTSLDRYVVLKRESDQEEAEANRVKMTYELNAILCPIYPQVALKIMHCEALHRERAAALALYT